MVIDNDQQVVSAVKHMEKTITSMRKLIDEQQTRIHNLEQSLIKQPVHTHTLASQNEFAHTLQEMIAE